MKKSRIILSALALALVVICALALASCEEKEITTAIQSAQIVKGGESVKLKATLDGDALADVGEEKVFLLALQSMDTSLANAEVVAEKKAKEKLTFEFPLYTENGDSRLTDAFVVATVTNGSYTALTEEFYITDSSPLALKNEGPNKVGGIKGVVTDDVYGAHLLGAEHTVIDTPIDLLMLAEHSEDAVRFNHEGVTYFFDGARVEALDKLVNDADLVGMRIYFRTLLGKSEDSRVVSDVYFDGARGADGYLPDMSDRTAARYVKAFYAFLATRYPVSDYIIGENVNNFSVNCNAGKIESDSFVKAYVSWLRAAHLTLRSVNSSATVYVSVNDYWRSDSSNDSIGARSFLEKLNTEAKRCGDFNYAVALNIGNGEDLPDLLAGKEYDYARIGASNLSDVTELFEKDVMYYNGSRRRLIVDGLSLSDSIGEANKAAYYTYAYYTAAECGFEAFILSDDVCAADAQRYDMYYAFLMCGTSRSAQLLDYTDRLGEVRIPDFSAFDTLELIFTQKVSMELDARILDKENKYKPSLTDFALGGSTTNLQGIISDNGERCWLVESDSSLGTGAVTLSSVPAKEFIKSAYVGLTVSSKTAPKIALVITNDNKEKVNTLYVGEVQTANGEATYYFNVSDFVKTVEESDTLTLSLCILAEGEDKESVEIKDISLLGDSKAGSSTVWVVIIVVVVVALFIALIVLLAMKRKNKRSPKKNNKKGSDKD